ncbi:MAG: penicillin-binding protein [Lactobacillus sp.]|nr:penicillin-binding protein [Lactobacillus sp.]
MKKLIKKFKRFLTAGPSVDELADQAGRQRRSFYVGTAYLTFRRVVKYIVVAFLFVLFLGFGFAGGYAVGIIRKEPIPTVQELQHELQNNDTSSTIYYAHHVRLAKVKAETTIKPAQADDLPTLFKQAVIATEDENFYQHKGILPKSIVRAVLSEVTGVGVQTGGSTLTQQLVKMRFLSNQTTWHRKIVEMFYARKIERYFSKDEILLSYLNAAPYGKNNSGENITGAKTAALGIFGKPLNKLNLPQMAFIAGLPQSPSTYTPYGLHGKKRKDMSLGMQRKNIVLFRMYRNGDISKKDYQAALHYNLKKDFLAPNPKKEKRQTSSYIYNLVTNKADVLLANYLIKQDGRKVKTVKQDDELYQQYLTNADQLMHQKGYHVETTFDKQLYQTMQTVLQQTTLGTDRTSRDFDTSKNKYVTTTEHVENGSVMIDNQTGKILAFAGGVDFKNSQVNHAFDTYRSPGSSIKPYLVYAPAVEHGIISNRTQLADFPTHFGKYIPTDYNQTVQNRFLSAQRALYMSYNLPAVNLYQKLIQDRINTSNYMDKLGFHLKASEYKKLGLALGGTDYGFTVAENASAFSTFYNEGRRADPYYISKITAPSGKVIYQHHAKSKRIFSKGTAYIMRHMLHQVVKQGTGSAINGTLQISRKNIIGKTGTSNDYRDIWFNGSTPGVTISSWIGYDNFYGHNYNLNENSNDANLNLWASMVNQLYQEKPSVFKLHKSYTRPSSVRSSRVLKKTGTKPGTVNYNGDQIRLRGKRVTALSLKPAPMATARFGIGAHERDYRLFYDHEQGKNNNYGKPLVYSGKTISKKHNLSDLFTPANGSTDYEEYYGHNQAESKTNNSTNNENVGANDQAAQTTGSGDGTGGTPDSTTGGTDTGSLTGTGGGAGGTDTSGATGADTGTGQAATGQ